MDNRLIKIITADFKPFNVVLKKGFIGFVKKCSEVFIS